MQESNQVITFGVIEFSFGIFKISFGVPISAAKVRDCLHISDFSLITFHFSFSDILHTTRHWPCARQFPAPASHCPLRA